MRTSGLLTDSCGQYGCNDDANPLHRAAIAAGRRQSQAGFRRSLRCAARGLTPPRADGLFAAKKPRRAIAVTRRAGAKRRTSHSAAQADMILHVACRRYGGLTAIGRRGAAALKDYVQDAP